MLRCFSHKFELIVAGKECGGQTRLLIKREEYDGSTFPTTTPCGECRGEIETEMIDGINVMFGNRNNVKLILK